LYFVRILYLDMLILYYLLVFSVIVEQAVLSM